MKNEKLKGKERKKMGRLKLSVITILIVALVFTVAIPMTASAATTKAPQKCPKCYKTYKITYTICDRVNITKSKVASYTIWQAVGSPVQNCDLVSKKIYFSAGKSTTTTYEVSGTFSYGNIAFGSKYTKSKTQSAGYSVPTGSAVKPNYYAQMYIGTDVDKYKLVAKHSLICHKCGYKYKQNYKTETGYKAMPLKNQAVKTKTKVSKYIRNVIYDEVEYYGCRAFGGGGGGFR